MIIQECVRRRQQLARNMLSASVAILWSAPQRLRNSDSEHPYRQDSNFYYLMAYAASESVCIITKDHHGEVLTILVIPDKDLEKEIWTGRRYSVREAEQLYAVDLAIYHADMSQYLERIIAEAEHLYFDYNLEVWQQQQIFTWVKNSQRHAKRYYVHPNMHDLAFLLKQARQIKSSLEINNLRQACHISAQAHSYILQNYRYQMSERDLELAFRKFCLEHNLSAMAYNPIVAGGKNACTLHYNANNQQLMPGDLVLIDAGAEYDFYAADITRTWPVNGKFSSAQKIIYEIVLRAQNVGIATAIPGKTWEDVHLAVLNVLVAGLLDCGLLSGTLEDNIEQETYKKYYMHGFGHWLGMDVHDQGIYRTRTQNHLAWQPLASGMVLTMEPGIYISDCDPLLDPMWHNIGIRIEDDILVTSAGNEVLSAAAPKTIADIEQLYATAL